MSEMPIWVPTSSAGSTLATPSVSSTTQQANSGAVNPHGPPSARSCCASSFPMA